MKKGINEEIPDEINVDEEEEGEEEEDKKALRKARAAKKIERAVSAKPLNALVDAYLKIEGVRISLQIRQTHLAKRGRQDPETDALLIQLLNVEHYLDDRITELVKAHPAYTWFSRVMGIGTENIAKIIGLVDIEKAPTISALRKFAGYAPGKKCSVCGAILDDDEVADHMLIRDPKSKALKCANATFTATAAKKVKGEKLSYNAELRTMCWRLGVGLLKAGLRKQCSVCGKLLGKKGVADHKDPESEDFSLKCANATFTVVATTKFSSYYLAQKASYTQRFLNEGRQIVPAEKLPRVKDPKDGKMKKRETDKFISEGHIHKMALRKMIQQFLAALWLVWRQALGLPIREPYSSEKLGHTHIYKPEDWLDR